MRPKRTFNRFLYGTIFSFLILLSFSFNLDAQNYCGSSPVQVHGDLSVSGAKIVDQNGNPVSFAGNSHFWSNTGWGQEKYYNADIVNWLKNDWNTTIVRAAMGVDESGGYLSDPNGNQQRVEAVVDAAIAAGLYVIIDWHSHHAEDYESEAISFFQEMATKYGNNPHVIYEIYNEPLQISWSGVIKPYAEAVIAAIRSIDSNNLIIVGTSTWSQDVDVASNDPITGFNNIAYALHFYAATHKESLRSRAQTAINNGLPLMVTEWGSVQASGNGAVDNASTDAWMDWIAANQLSHLNWSIADKAEGASIINPGTSSNGGWSSSDLTASGTKVKNIISNWQQNCGGGGGNNAPSVSITNPANNSTFDSGATISVSANANDSDGSVMQVEFFANGISIGIDNSGPFTVSWAPSTGTYSLTAVATDNDEAMTTSGVVSVEVEESGSGGQSSAYPNGVPHAIPGTILAVNYNTGGEGSAYNDADDGNNGTGPRQNENVDTENRAPGGNVGWIEGGEWLEFTVDVAQSGNYDVSFNVASLQNGSRFHLTFDGNDVTGDINVNSTGGWGDFTLINVEGIPLTEGEQTMRLVFDQGPFNIGALEFSISNSGGPDNQPPMVNITDPTNGTSIEVGETVTIQANATDSDGSISSVSFYVNNALIATDNTAPYQTNWSPSIEGSFTIYASAIDNDNAETQSSSIQIIANSPGGGGGGNCEFDTPQSAPLETIHESFSNAHVIGSGGPNLNNVTNFVINWDLQNSGLYQLSFNTNNGQPSWWMDLRSDASHGLGDSQPDITFSGTGIAGFDGAYWVTTDGDNLVMVSKNGDYTIYFNNASTAPNCNANARTYDETISENIVDNENSINELVIFPQPASSKLVWKAPKDVMMKEISIVDMAGKVMNFLVSDDKREINIASLPSGVYLFRLITSKDEVIEKRWLKK